MKSYFISLINDKTVVGWNPSLDNQISYLMMILDASVFPEPDSPDITIHVSFDDRFMV